YTLSQLAAGAPPPACTFALSSASESVGATGGPISVGVSTNSGCNWTATSQAPWITITTGASGAGDGTVRLSVIANRSSSPRTGTVTIAGQPFTVNQSGTTSTSCTYSLSATSTSVDASGATASVTVTTQAACTWSAVANATWLSIGSGASGTGNGTVQYSVAANSDPAPRSGTLTIAGQTFTINQAAAPSSCTYTVSPTSMSVAAGAGSTS